MEQLLSAAMKRRVGLLDLLGGNHWMTSDRLASSIKCSKKSIMQDYQYIEENWGEYLTIETSKKNGVRFNLSPHHSIHGIYREIIQASPAFQLLESIFFESKQPAEFHQRKLFLSPSSLYRLSNSIAKSLTLRKLTLERSPYQISSQDERQVRYFFVAYFIEVYGIHQWPFPVPKESVIRLARNINQDFSLKLNDVQLVQLAFSIVVTIIRERQGFLIPNQQRSERKFRKSAAKVQLYEEQVVEIVENLAVKLPNNWYQDFCYSIFWWDFGWDNQQETENILQQSNELVETIKGALKITLTADSRASLVRFLTYIYAKHKMYPYKKYMIYDRYSYSGMAIKQSYIVFTAVVSKALQVLQQKTKFPWYSMYLDEILHEMMIRWANLTNLLEGLRQQVSVAILSDLGEEHTQLLARYLEEKFPHKVQVFLQESSLYEEENIMVGSCFDLYVSNYSVPRVSEDQLIIVEDIPSLKNLIDLGNYIERRRLILPESITYLHT